MSAVSCGSTAARAFAPSWIVRAKWPRLAHRTAVYAGVRANKLYRLGKETGEKEVVYPCDDEVLACAVTPDGGRVLIADNAQGLYGFTGAGERLWKMDLAGVIPLLLQLYGERLVGADMPELLCLDVSEAALRAARAGRVPRMRKSKVPRGPGIEPPESNEGEEMATPKRKKT
jgi:hypothetical protein